MAKQTKPRVEIVKIGAAPPLKTPLVARVTHSGICCVCASGKLSTTYAVETRGSWYGAHICEDCATLKGEA